MNEIMRPFNDASRGLLDREHSFLVGAALTAAFALANYPVIRDAISHLRHKNVRHPGYPSGGNSDSPDNTR